MLPHYSVSRSCTQPSLGGSIYTMYTYGVQQWQAGSIPQDHQRNHRISIYCGSPLWSISVPYAPTSLAPSPHAVRVRMARIHCT
ncbi:hypothetical protein BDV29DRAFT_171383 [Aspergillus leporis]|uniref:Uncharacterized protein n=1 Tax=Aspergillus leporis TaxID=41062 RepID=A0A5N5X880_9EURO|nr:hypothetical protein BDV29DRAFT_171383 [Aspergillus leporis]